VIIWILHTEFAVFIIRISTTHSIGTSGITILSFTHRGTGVGVHRGAGAGILGVGTAGIVGIGAGAGITGIIRHIIHGVGDTLRLMLAEDGTIMKTTITDKEEPQIQVFCVVLTTQAGTYHQVLQWEGVPTNSLLALPAPEGTILLQQ
jgi:hypothetical protein